MKSFTNKLLVLWKQQTLLALIIVGLLSGLLLFLKQDSRIEVDRSRTDASVQVVQEVSEKAIEQEQTPLGIAREYRFQVAQDLERDTCLAFYVSHHYADVSIGQESVYSLRPSSRISNVKTVGSNWVMVPLYPEDSGKEVRVVLTPVYQNYTEAELEFLIGPAMGIYQSQLFAALPEIILCIINFVIGFLVMGIAVYYMCRKHHSTGLLAAGMLAIAVSLWRLFDTVFMPFVAGQNAVLCYTVSISMLMIIVVMLFKSTKSQFHQKGSRLIEVASIIIELVFIAQLLLQIVGMWDLRETLFITHMAIAVCVLLVIGITIYEWIRYAKCGKVYKGRYTVWVLACGGLADLIMYYVRDTSSKLLFIQTAILVFDILEGAGFLRNYTAQEQRLLEKELQLTQSRSITMMQQIRSHFVFNILNAISGMCKYDPKKADETVVQFARYLRSNIDIMQEDVPVAFEVTMRHLEDYIALEKIRFGDKIRFETDIQDDNFMLPPLILQPLVENSIKHGLLPKPSGGTVFFSTRAEGDEILITIEDDGIGFQTDAPYRTGAVGLQNVRFRLEHMAQGKMIMESTPGKGTKVTITIPRKEIDSCI